MQKGEISQGKIKKLGSVLIDRKEASCFRLIISHLKRYQICRGHIGLSEFKYPSLFLSDFNAFVIMKALRILHHDRLFEFFQASMICSTRVSQTGTVAAAS